MYLHLAYKSLEQQMETGQCKPRAKTAAIPNKSMAPLRGLCVRILLCTSKKNPKSQYTVLCRKPKIIVHHAISNIFRKQLENGLWKIMYIICKLYLIMWGGETRVVY